MRIPGATLDLVTPLQIRITGLLLVGGLALFLIGAAGWKPWDYQKPLPQALPILHAERGRMRWIYSWMALGVATSITGLAALRDLLLQTGSGVLASATVALFGVGGTLWIVALLFHLTVQADAAAETARTGAVPPGYPSLHRWAGALYSGQMLLCYLSWATLGGAVLQGELLPQAFGWTCLGGGIVYALGFVLTGGGFFAPPFWVHTLPGVAGVLLLLR